MTLAHVNSDIRGCQECAMAGALNAHTGLDYVPRDPDAQLYYLRPHAESLAESSVKDVGGSTLTCWCGHALHYANCPESGYCEDEESTHHGACARQYRRAEWQPTMVIRTMQPPFAWACPSEHDSHDADETEWIDGQRTLRIICARCGDPSTFDCATGTTARE